MAWFLVTSPTVIESEESSPSDVGSEAWILFLGAQIKLTVWPGADCTVLRLWPPWGFIIFFKFSVEKASQIHPEHVK